MTSLRQANANPAEPRLSARLNRRQWVYWILTTLLVLAAGAVLVRLGLWQLDRHRQRLALNQQVSWGMAQPPLDLNGSIPSGLDAMEYRSAMVTGEYDFSQQVLLRNQAWEGQAGYHILTPLLIQGSDQAVLVDRGFIPMGEEGFSQPVDLSPYDQPGLVAVEGQLMRSQPEPRFGGVPDPELQPGQSRLDAWNFINLERIGRQVDRPLLSMYLVAAPEPGAVPLRSIPEVDLSEGSHMGYALQWFAFAAILLIGYPFYVRKQLRSPRT